MLNQQELTMTELNFIQLAAKDMLVTKYRKAVLNLTRERWIEVVNDQICIILDHDFDTQQRLIEEYQCKNDTY